MKTLILSPQQSATSVALEVAAERLGWSAVRASSYSVPEGLSGDDFAVYGAPIFSNLMATSCGFALLGCPKGWIVSVPFEYLKRDIKIVRLADIGKLSRPVFIKASNDKSLPAKVYENNLPTELMNALLDRIVVAFSPYKFKNYVCHYAHGISNGIPVPDDEMSQGLLFMNEALKDDAFELPPAVVVDIGRIPEKGWAIVEANEVWASGIYGCQPEAVLPVIARACVPINRLDMADRRWDITEKIVRE